MLVAVSADCGEAIWHELIGVDGGVKPGFCCDHHVWSQAVEEVRYGSTLRRRRLQVDVQEAERAVSLFILLRGSGGGGRVEGLKVAGGGWERCAACSGGREDLLLKTKEVEGCLAGVVVAADRAVPGTVGVFQGLVSGRAYVDAAGMVPQSTCFACKSAVLPSDGQVADSTWSVRVVSDVDSGCRHDEGDEEGEF